MSAVRALSEVTEESNAVAEVQAMQDVLYDILATGIDPDESDAPGGEIERFLHEHARAPKDLGEFRAFFAKHGLSVHTRPLPQSSAELSLPPIECPPAANAAIELPQSMLEDEHDTDAQLIRPSLPLRPPPPPHAKSRRFGWLAAALAFSCVTAALGFVAFRGYAELSALRAEVGRASQHNRHNQQAIAALRDHAKDIETSVTATGELVQRMDQKSDLVLQFVQAEEAKQAAKKRR